VAAIEMATKEGVAQVVAAQRLSLDLQDRGHGQTTGDREEHRPDQPSPGS
jgi:hypothetical protein